MAALAVVTFWLAAGATDYDCSDCDADDEALALELCAAEAVESWPASLTTDDVVDSDTVLASGILADDDVPVVTTSVSSLLSVAVTGVVGVASLATDVGAAALEVETF